MDQENRVSGKTVGAVVGLAFGVVVLTYGVVAGGFLAACTFAGWWIGRLLDGEIHLGELLDRYSGRERI
jgi:hypothetical protein